jgi:hypothetical protein
MLSRAQAQLEAADLEAGAPVAEILPSRFKTPVDPILSVGSRPFHEMSPKFDRIGRGAPLPNVSVFLDTWV